MKSLIQGFLTGMRVQARVLAPRKVISPRFSRHLSTPREISPLWERIPCMGVQVPLGHSKSPYPPVSGHAEWSPGAQAAAGVRRSAFRAFSSFLVRALQPV